MKQNLPYSLEPENQQAFTAEFDQFYTQFAPLYDGLIKLFPIWQNWINQVLPYVQGPRILEISFGTGSLLSKYDRDLQITGLEYNREMIQVARKNVSEDGRQVHLQQGDVNHLPYPDNTFDTLINTMAFTAYPDGRAAMKEMHRVLRPGGRLLLVDIDFPLDGNWLGIQMARLWMLLGDILRDMGPIFQNAGFDYTEQEIGAFGSVHLFMATKKVG